MDNILKDYGVDLDSSLKLLGDMDTYNEILTDFYNDLDNKLNNLLKYKNDNDLENYSIVVHALKGECNYLGFNKFAEDCYQHQIKSEEEDINFINNNFTSLQNQANEIKKIVEKYLGIM